MVLRATTATLTAPAPVAPAAVDHATFRQALGRLAAGVSVITTTDRDNQPVGLTATAVSAVSVDPPLILVCLGHWARALAPLEARTPFIVHLLAAEQQPLAQHFATPLSDKFADVAHSPGLGGSPRLADALAWIECLPYQIVPAGDHTIVVGRVITLQLGTDEREPLVYFRRQFHTLRAQGALPSAH